MTTARNATHKLTDSIHRLFTISTTLPTALRNLRNAAPGYPTSSGGHGGPTLNEDGTPQGLDRYLSDPVSRDQNEIANLVERIHSDTIRLLYLSNTWTADSKPLPTKSADCEACGTHVTGTANDRLRAGLCDACRMNWKRWQEQNSGDRHEWLWQRREATKLKRPNGSSDTE